MLDCEGCGKRHRTEETVERCCVRAEKRKVREKKKAEDVEKRRLRQEQMSEEEYIRQTFCNWRVGKPAVNVAADLNREWPKREDGKKWTFVDVLTVHVSHLTWPEGW